MLVEAVRWWPVAAEAWVRSQVSPNGISDG